MVNIITQVPPTEIVQAGAASSTAKPATEVPLIESGDGDVGLSLKYAREDHVHPASVPVTPPLVVLRSYLAGLKLTWVSGTEFSVAAGQAADNTNAIMMNLPAVISKTTSNWVAGNGGGLDTGTISTADWYHVFLIRNPTTNTVDVVFSATATPDAGPTTLPTGFTQWRRIGSTLTVSSQWRAFTQYGDDFQWVIAPTDAASVAITNGFRTLYTLTVPTGIQVYAWFRIQYSTGIAGQAMILTSPDETDTAGGFGVNTGGYSLRGVQATATESINNAAVRIRTDTLGRVGCRASTGGSASISFATMGWTDRRGRDN